ncbi:MAG: hypothetical protein IJ493_04660 [Clostridia bacterium]|nr:hypothetical protein [Clostridia bacterium]
MKQWLKAPAVRCALYNQLFGFVIYLAMAAVINIGLSLADSDSNIEIGICIWGGQFTVYWVISRYLSDMPLILHCGMTRRNFFLGSLYCKLCYSLAVGLLAAVAGIICRYTIDRVLIIAVIGLLIILLMLSFGDLFGCLIHCVDTREIQWKVALVVLVLLAVSLTVGITTDVGGTVGELRFGGEFLLKIAAYLVCSGLCQTAAWFCLRRAEI